MTVHCKVCDGKSFPNVSSLRKHQWAEHREIYAKVTASAMNQKNRQRQRQRTTVQRNGNITTDQLLDRLKAQRDFMKDIVDMVERMLEK